MKMLAAHIICVFFVSLSAPTRAAVICDSTSKNCKFFINNSGALIDATSGKTIALDVGNTGMMADVSVYRYGAQYTLIRESNSNDHAIIAVPISQNGNDIGFKIAYYISIDMIASSGKQQAKWSGKKVISEFRKINGEIWTTSEKLLDNVAIKITHASGFPETTIYIATDELGDSEHCFAPFRKDGNNFPTEFISCRKVNTLLTDGENVFSGTIGNIPVEMALSNRGDSLSGKYRYLRQNSGWIDLRGVISKNGEVSIGELDRSTEAVTASFSGVVRDGALSGHWVSADGRRALPFELYVQGFADN
ncbi:hypothetical protein FAZ69_21240 [Trinickia terrae]|uniref:Uncharacterized protein n=1 Tax=Trinickia terrae TaxID=2571161 RepID=A0A4U1HZW1_9BURK|nr:hypothetical protein [Trinickia terrae]TKC85856.1 hypothetical protein FAZ69_21240 [Trinickia terrae]